MSVIKGNGMVEVTTQTHLRRSTIDCSSVQRVADSMKAFLGLKPPRPEGFTPGRDMTHVETIIESNGSGIGPIHLSSSCARLVSYAARYEDNQLGLLIVSGRCIAEALYHGEIQRALEEVTRATLFHGPIKAHTMVSFLTPLTMLDIEHTAVEHLERTQMHELIMRQTTLDGGRLPNLNLAKIVFRGWSTAPQAAPTCVLDGMSGLPLWLKVCWGSEIEQQHTFKLV